MSRKDRWTAHDAARLRMLQDELIVLEGRRARAMDALTAFVAESPEKTFQGIAEHLVTHADEARNMLEPFDSSVSVPPLAE